MVEEAIESFVEAQGLWFAVVVLAAGGVILIAFVEKLISYMTRAAVGLGVSVFSLAILFTGFEFDDTILALVFASGGLEDAALGTALGTALAIVGITLAVAAVARPFSVEIPRDYLALMVVSPLILLPLVLLGTLSVIHGVALLGVFFAFLAYIVYMEHHRDVPVFRDTDVVERVETDGGIPQSDGGVTAHERLEPILEDRLVGGLSYAGYVWVGLAGVALAGVVLGSVLIEAGSEVVLEESGLEETVFGATVITLLLTFENVLLTLEPVRRGIPEIGIGHVIGSVVFSVTGNIGFILLLADLNIGSSVLYFHFPALLVVTALGAYFIATGRIRRWHGLLLGGLYVGYWIVAVFVFGGVPISG
ncbi:sodium:calcium antiporter [Halalkalicoccus sp. NIPERK01]|uniref:sodium:calcium antiporter n=1 Tax=Halalkalicoccus sp. NIPERK01 TaxID=3053469 RepID=UPI00256EFB69|nr:sodium:proton exchanger [Halalkalicoccus sp. NIPERK01]MDL5362475.1 sodium:proton exchanger [Halalkalicoccus sp. NIPERK01]